MPQCPNGSQHGSFTADPAMGFFSTWTHLRGTALCQRPLQATLEWTILWLLSADCGDPTRPKPK